MQSLRQPHLAYAHYMRGIAILLIVATHCSTIFSAETMIREHYTLSLFRHGNLLFIFIAGFLFQYLLPRFGYLHYLKKKCLYVVLPYLIVSAPFIYLYAIGSKEHYFVDITPFTTPEIVVFMLFTGAHLEPLWFIPMICIFYLFAPFFRFVDEHPRLYALFPVFLVVALYTGRPDYSLGPVQNFIFFLPAYMFGMMVCHFREKLLPFLAKHALFINTLWVIPLCIAHVAENDLLIYLIKFPLCIGLMGIFYKYPAFRGREALNRLADFSFGIFFMHNYAVGFTHTHIDIDQPIMVILIYLAYLFLVLALSLGGVLAVKRLSGRLSRYIIGC